MTTQKNITVFMTTGFKWQFNLTKFFEFGSF
jgi:hypothetical protein